MKEDSDNFDDLYQDYWSIHSKMIDRGHSPLAIAGILVAQSMILYRTVLDPKEYDEMVDSISKLRYEVKELKPERANYH